MLKYIDKAWNQKKQSTIANCFRKAVFKSVSAIEESPEEMNIILNTAEQLVRKKKTIIMKNGKGYILIQKSQLTFKQTIA